jgi:hypothetical protein
VAHAIGTDVMNEVILQEGYSDGLPPNLKAFLIRASRIVQCIAEATLLEWTTSKQLGELVKSGDIKDALKKLFPSYTRQQRHELLARLYGYELFPSLVLGGKGNLRKLRKVGVLLHQYIFPSPPDPDTLCYCSLKEFLVASCGIIVVCPGDPVCGNVSLDLEVERTDLEVRLDDALATMDARLVGRRERKQTVIANREGKKRALKALADWRTNIPVNLHQTSAGDNYVTGTSDNDIAVDCTWDLNDGSNFVDVGCDTAMFLVACRVSAYVRGVKDASFYGLEVRPVMNTVATLLNHPETQTLWDRVNVRREEPVTSGAIECRSGNFLEAKLLSDIGVSNGSPTTLYAYNLGYIHSIYEHTYTHCVHTPAHSPHVPDLSALYLI